MFVAARGVSRLVVKETLELGLDGSLQDCLTDGLCVGWYI